MVLLTAQDLIEEPDFIKDVADYKAFFAKQSQLYTLLQQPEVLLHVESGKHYLIKPKIREPSSVPHTFYFQIICGAVAMMIGMSVLAYNFSSTSARLYALTGFSFMLLTFSAAAYSSRELALQGDLFRFLNAVNHGNAFIFSAAFVSLLWYYPSRLGGAKFPALAFALGALAFLSEIFLWFDNNDLTFRYPILLALLTSLILGIWQWVASRKDPLRRAAVKWFLLTLLLGLSNSVQNFPD